MKETKFKNTEIGKIPEDWEVTPIGKACNVRRGVRVTKEQLTDEGRYPVYQNTNCTVPADARPLPSESASGKTVHCHEIPFCHSD